jgi:hypothetical protein
MKHAVAAIVLCAALAACAPSAPLATTPPAPDARFAVTDIKDYGPEMVDAVPSDPPTLKVAYGTASKRQFGELRVPKGKGPFPIAVIYHGGCWAGMGGPSNVAALASFLAETYPLDLKRISVMGHSAGVTPVMWLPSGDMGDEVIRPDLPAIRAAVAIDGPLSVGPFVGIDAMICGQPVIAPMMGGIPAEVPARYAMLDPLVNKPLVKRLLVVDGALPDPEPEVIEGLRAQGIAVDVIRVSQEQHFNMLVPGTKDFAAIGPALLDIAGGR